MDSFSFGSGDNIGVAIVGDVGDLRSKLSQGEAAVDSFGRKTKRELRGVGDEAARLGTGVDRLATGFKGAFVGGSVAVGLVKLKNLTMDAVSALSQAQVQLDRLDNGFAFGAGGMVNGAREMAFVRAEVNRLGLELGGTANQYMKMVAASRGTDMAGEKTRDLFRSIAEASVVMGMGVDQSERSFMAVTQMMSKGKVMAEELRGQLGEHLPGAFSIAARAMNMTEAELNKLMETGGLMADEFLPRFAEQLRTELAGSVDHATLSMQANLNRLSTAWINLKQQTARGGVGSAISEEVKGMSTELMVLGETMEAARLRGDGMWASIANTSGAAIGRSAFGALELTFESFNGAVNALTGGVFDLNTNLDLMPDNLKPVNVQLELTAQKVAQAEKEYQILAERLSMVPDNIYLKSDLNQLGLYIERLREAQAEKRALMGLNSQGAGSVGNVAGGDVALARAERADYDRRKALLDKFNFDHRSASEKFRDEVAKQKAALGDLYSPEVEAKIRDRLIKPTRGAGAAAKAAKDEFADLLNQVTARDAGYSKVFYADLNTLHAGYRAGRVDLDEYRGAVTALINQQQFAKDAATDLEAAQRALGEAMAAASELALKDEQGYIDSANAMAESNAELRNEIELIGLNDRQRAALVVTKEMELVADKEALLVSQQNAGASATVLQNLEREIALRRERVGLLVERDAAQQMADAMEKQVKASKTFWDSVDRTAHDVFVSVANEGEDAFKRIGKTLKAAVLDMLYQITVKKWIVQISGSFTGGGGGTGNSWLDLAQQAYSYYSSGSSAAAGTGAISNGMTQAQMLQAQEAGMGTAVGGGAASTSSTMASGGWTGYGYLGYAALIAAAVIVAEGLYDKGYTRRNLGYGDPETVNFGQNSSYTSDPSIQRTNLNYTPGSMLATMGRELGDMLGVSEKWVDIFSGTTRMATLIGRKLKAVGVEADVAAGELGDVRGYAFYKGGAFRSNKTQNFALDEGDAQRFQRQIRGWVDGSKNMARALGYSEEAIDSFTGKVRINLKGATTGAEVAQRYADAQETLTREMLSAASGTKITKDAFKDMMEGIRGSIQNAGISSEGLLGIISQGAMQKLSGEQIGEQISATIIGGIQKTIIEQAYAPVIDELMSTIVTPVFTAIMAGVPVAEVISQGAIDSIVESANRAADALDMLFSNEAFMEAMDRMHTGFRNLGRSVSRASSHIRSYGSAVSTSAQAAQQAAQERFGLETRLQTLLGNTTKLRERELNAVAAANRPLQQMIWTLEDAKGAVDSAMESFGRAISAQREALESTREQAQDLESRLNDVFDTLRANIRELRGEVEQGNTMQGAQALALIRSAAASGVVPDGEALNDAITSARQLVEGAQYGSRFERDRALLALSNDLDALRGVVQPQLSAAEQQVVALDDQLAALDALQRQQEDAVNALYGIDNRVLSVVEAVNALHLSMAGYSAAVAAGMAVSVGSSAPVAPVSSGGGYSGGGYSGGGYSGGGSSGGKQWTAQGYWDKNPDLQTEFNDFNLANSPDFNKDPKLSARDEYLAWHWATRGQKENRKFAQGGVFSNSIVTRPTFFDVGQMGEAGAEGVLPLANVGGRLGVHANASGDPEVRRLLGELVQRMDRIERATGKTAEESRELRRLAQKADELGLKARGENVL